jgi:uncharacterized protein
MDYLLFYDYTDDYLERRAEFRTQHLKRAWESQARGDLVLAGAMTTRPYGAVFHFRGTSPAVAEDFARTDPYVVNGLVSSWRVREWTTVVGDAATTPMRP